MLTDTNCIDPKNEVGVCMSQHTQSSAQVLRHPKGLSDVQSIFSWEIQIHCNSIVDVAPTVGKCGVLNTVDIRGVKNGVTKKAAD